MSGVRSGTRLEQLRNLRRQVLIQREQARRDARYVDKLDLTDLLGRVDAAILDEQAYLRSRPRVAVAVRNADDNIGRRLDQLGVTTRQVKTWAVGAGLLPAVQRGRVGMRIVDAYAQAHQEHT